MPYRVTAPLVLAKDERGVTHHHYEREIIDWLSDEQREQWLAEGLIEEIGTPQIEAIELAELRRQQQVDDAEAERVRRCVEVLTELDIPLGVGRPRVRAALEARGHRFANETLAAAIKERRELSGTPGMPAWPGITEGPTLMDGQAL